MFRVHVRPCQPRVVQYHQWDQLSPVIIMFCVRSQQSSSFRALSLHVLVERLKSMPLVEDLAAQLRGFNSLVGQFNAGAAWHMMHTHTHTHTHTLTKWSTHKFGKCHATDNEPSHTGFAAGKLSTLSNTI